MNMKLMPSPISERASEWVGGDGVSEEDGWPPGFFCQPWLNVRRTLTTSRVLCSWCTDVHSRVETRDQLYTFNTAAAAAVAAAHSKWENGGGGGLVCVQ